MERLRDKLSNESLADRIARMLAQVERAADGAASGAKARSERKRAAASVPVAGVESEGAESSAPTGRLYSVRAALLFSPGNAARDADAKGRMARRQRKPSRPLPPL